MMPTLRQIVDAAAGSHSFALAALCLDCSPCDGFSALQNRTLAVFRDLGSSDAFQLLLCLSLGSSELKPTKDVASFSTPTIKAKE
ncbi:hypothetical protein INT43_006444 [Umbelopsis isabellina]|uniref:Uncharacterized protein n=1 Tax=Mortierella isabellina TaxID=91625 RepID=A0A8H7Q036_MORIS|nr:hypothetical protein INT43_006444 [Umbelopsis isabellina]